MEFDKVNFKITARASGEEFTIGKHTQNAEVKAITYSAMQIHDRPEVERPELFVIVDIWYSRLFSPHFLSKLHNFIQSARK